MRNTINRALVAKKRLFFFMMATMLATALSAGTVNYTADDVSIFPNPERGFITMLERHGNKTRYAVKGKESYLTALRTNDKGSLILVLYYLDEYKNAETLPDSILSAFDEDMAVLRNYGMKCILRFAYTAQTYKIPNPDPKKDSIRTAADAPLSIIQKHLNQYKSHWEANADVIFCFQAGFIGAYGEWYYTDNFTNTSSHMTPERKAFLDTLLNATPKNRTVQLRTPLFKTDYMDSIYGSHGAITESEAYKGTPKARLAHHNDAFLNGYQNQGTYRDTATQKPYIAQETLYMPIGGECNIEDSIRGVTAASHDSTVMEMSRLHWTFIQGGFSTKVTNRWRQEGTFDELNRNMGYRYQLVEGTYDEAATVNGTLHVSLQIKNVGYAPLYNERHAYVVLKNENAAYALKLTDIDPRTWKPGNSYTIEKTLTIPDTAYNGTYDLYLWLPDAYESLQNDARYAIRIANEDVWEEASGMNALGAQVVVSGGSDAPDTSIHLPATLNKANHSAVSDEKWYNTDYFNFGDAWGEDGSDGHNLSRWIEWKVKLVYPGEYIVSEVGYCTNGHSYLLELKQGETTISSFTAVDTDHWGEGDQSYTQKEKWDLSSTVTGIYTLRVHNSTDYGKPKLKSLTLQYNGDIPSGIDEVAELELDAQPYDILGRPVDDSYHGIVIMRGKKILR